MTALGLSLIAIGFALVCAGLVFRLRAPRAEPASPEGPDEFRTVLDALEEGDLRDEPIDHSTVQDPARRARPRPLQ